MVRRRWFSRFGRTMRQTPSSQVARASETSVDTTIVPPPATGWLFSTARLFAAALVVPANATDPTATDATTTAAGTTALSCVRDSMVSAVGTLATTESGEWRR